jgi:hypothetical protein
MRQLLSVLAFGALASISFGQNTLTRIAVPRLSGAATSELIKSVAGPQGSTYSLLAGFDQSNTQVLGIAKQTGGSGKTIIAEFSTGLNNTASHMLDLAVDTSGNAYVMYDTPDNLSDVQVRKVSPTTGIVWTTSVSSQWVDPDFNLHPYVDQGTELKYSADSNSVYVLSRRRQGDPSPGNFFPVISRLSANGTISWTRFFNVIDLTSRGQITADQDGSVALAFGALVQTDPEADPPTTSSLVAAKLSSTASLIYSTVFSTATDTDPGNDMSVDDVTTGSDNSLLILGEMNFITVSNGNQFPTQAQLLMKFDAFGFGQFTVVRRQFDEFGRPGTFAPHAIAPDASGGAYVTGGVADFDDLFKGYVEHYSGFGTSDLGLKVGDYGENWSIGVDGYGNAYVGGTRIAIGSTGAKYRGVAMKFDPAFDIEQDLMVLRTEYSLNAPSGYIPATSGFVPGVVNVFPRTMGNPVFAANEVTKLDTGYDQSGALLVVADNPETIGFTVDNSNELAGYPLKVIVTIDRPAPEGGHKVRITSSNENVIPSQNVLIPAGKKGVQAFIKTPKLTATTALTLFAGPNNTLSQQVTLTPIAVTLTPNKRALVKNDDFVLTVSIAQDAPAGGLEVPLKSSKPSLIAVPSSVKIGLGKREVKVALHVNGEVASNTTVTISGGPGFAATTTVTVVPVGVKSLTLDKSIVFGGNSVEATVVLSGPAPNNAKLTLNSTNAAIHVPIKAVTIPQGTTVMHITIPTDEVNRQVKGYVSATFNSTARAALTLTAVEIASLSVDASVLGGDLLNGTVTLNRVAPAGGTPVEVQSDKAEVPSTTVLVPEGSKTMSFSVQTMPVETDSPVVLIASTQTMTATSQTVVLAPKITKLDFDPAIVVSGDRTVLTIRLSGVAPQGGLTINLESNDSTALSVPPSVVVKGGAKVIKVNLTGGSVTSNHSVTVTATLNGASKTGAVTVKPA